MSFQVKTSYTNDYRCSCCQRWRYDTELVPSNTDIVSRLPTTFPRLCSTSGGIAEIQVIDTTTLKEVASSKLSYPPRWNRSAVYAYTQWTLWVDEESFPGQGIYQTQTIRGTGSIDLMRETQEDLEFLTDSWSDLCAALKKTA